MKMGTHCFIGSVKNSASEVGCLPHNTSDILNDQGGIGSNMTDNCQEGLWKICGRSTGNYPEG